MNNKFSFYIQTLCGMSSVQHLKYLPVVISSHLMDLSYLSSVFFAWFHWSTAVSEGAYLHTGRIVGEWKVKEAHSSLPHVEAISIQFPTDSCKLVFETFGCEFEDEFWTYVVLHNDSSWA